MNTILVLVKGGVVQGVSGTENALVIIQDLDNYDRENPDPCIYEEPVEVLGMDALQSKIAENAPC